MSGPARIRPTRPARGCRLANLRTYSAADSERTVGSCASASDPYDPGAPQPIDGEPIDRDPHVPLACSAGGATGGLPILLSALAAIGLRRRR